MLFVDPYFLFLFLPLVTVGVALLRRSGHYAFLLPLVLLSSCVFYSVWSAKYLALALALMASNYACAKLISQTHSKHKAKFILYAGISLHLFTLVYFKYTGFLAELFFIENPIDIVLPLAISFYTFQQISYLVDVYLKKQNIVSILNYATFILFFPQLIAGPIVQYGQIGKQIERFKAGQLTPQYTLGLSYLLIGLIKKWFIADTLAPMANSSFAFASLDGQIEPLFAWLGVLAYTFQLYFDFSAYGDMAIGIALLIGFKLPINFDSPYKSVNISEFWRRWHITLGTFLRQYLFIPLGGSRGSSWLTMRNLFIVMLLGGIWHGAGLGFFLWGCMHGTALIIHSLFKRFASKINTQIFRPIYVSLTFMFVFLAWVPFKSVTLTTTFAMYNSMFSISDYSLGEQFELLSTYYGFGGSISQTLLLTVIPLIVWGCQNSHHYALLFEKWLTKTNYLLRQKATWMQYPVGIVSGILVMIGVKWMTGMPVESFLYFQF